MIPAARVAAAIEILTDIETRRRPAADALKDWGLARRFAGSGDRAAVASLVFDALRRKTSSAWIMGEASPRAEVIGALKLLRNLGEDEVSALFTGEGHAPAPLSNVERERLRAGDLTEAPAHVRGDYPEWLAAAFAESFGDSAVEEGRALANRAPVDLRVNLLKAGRDPTQAALAHLDAAPTPFSPVGLRIPVRADGRGPALSAEPAYVKGLVEVQDEGSQLAALLSGAKPGMQALDLCAGAGGKTLALAAMMDNHGQIYATDDDGRRLAPIFDRLARSGARNVQVRAPRGTQDRLADLEARCDLVVIDAPCSGSGAWRRNPDAKWRMRPGALEQRIKDQVETLESAARFVKPGGRIVYITCSLLKAENEDRVAAFLESRPEFLPLEAAHWARACGLEALAAEASRLGPGVRLSPLRTGTDGFYVAVLARSA
ncbi:MAG TPA: RsmB/NOP family class I SAM-dependent RNA methyltransferase [Roseiarcus sp.]|jgi:16S rRNA (cytosine967-C5)-methyltransferase